MDGQPFHYPANSIFISLLSISLLYRWISSLPGAVMNPIPTQLTAVKRDYSRVRVQIRRVNLTLQTPLQIRHFLDRLTALRTRLLRCRRVISSSARQFRARLFRSSFALWRSLVKRLVLIPALCHVAARHIHQLLHDIPIIDPQNWALRLIVFDGPALCPIMPEILSLAPPTARDTPTDPYWRALKGNMSLASL